MPPPNATHLAGWLNAQLTLDPYAQYPLIAATLIYGGQAGERDDIVARREAMWDLIESAFIERPAERWRHAANLTVILFHRGEPERALRLSGMIRELAGDVVPAWARNLEFLYLVTSDEAEAAALLLEAMLADGQVTDPAERRLLEQRLESLGHASGRAKGDLESAR